ncbi:hypothetical protein R6Q59_013366 [Mikania micrantha]
MEVDQVSAKAVETGVCMENKEQEMDVGRVLPGSLTGGCILPDSFFDASSSSQPAANGPSEYKRTLISDYITVANAVPLMVANAWDSAEWNYFAVQCQCRALVTDYVVVDDDSFLEDYLLDDVDMPPLPEYKKQAILKALNSNAKAVKAKNMPAWSVSKWKFFKDQVASLGLNMDYVIEDVEEEDNVMAALLRGKPRSS